MYDIKKCSQVADSITYQSFTDGFADYMVHVEMDENFFLDRFFGPEGNDRELSFIAFKGDKPVGITLGGIKDGENMKTLRCGGMSVIPSERGTGLAKELMDHHEEEARRIGCKQLFLEVINGNDRAINFYKKIGYEKIYDLTYRKLELKGDNPIYDMTINDIKVEEMTYGDIRSLREMDFSHLPWQADFPYFKNSPCSYYGIRDKGKIIAGIVASNNRLIYLWVHPNYRNKGYAKSLLNKVIHELKPDELNVMYSNNSEAHTFANYLKMKVKEFGQYEMYKLLV